MRKPQDEDAPRQEAENMTPIGELIRNAREKAEMTRTEAARAAGTTEDHLAGIEAGTLTPEADELFEITAALATDLRTLLQPAQSE